MGVITREQLVLSADAYEAAVAAGGVVDTYCSSLPWIDAALTAFAPNAVPFVIQTDSGFAPLALRAGSLRWVAPWEASWGLTSPMVGADLDRLAGDVVDELLARRGDWDALFLSGLARHGAAFQGLVRRLHGRFRLGASSPSARCVASLEGGADGFLGRRSPKFRKSLRQAERANDGRIAFAVERDVGPDRAAEVYAAILAIEALSWKGREGVGITDGPMRVFYGEMIPRLAAAGRLRVTWATVEGLKVGYVLGGVFGDSYRGLQFSFDATYAELSVGNLMQWVTIRALCDEGIAHYDLGAEMEYKLRWAERRVESVALVVR